MGLILLGYGASMDAGRRGRTGATQNRGFAVLLLDRPGDRRFVDAGISADRRFVTIDD